MVKHCKECNSILTKKEELTNIDTCDACLHEEDNYCENCGEELNEKEKKEGEHLCYPCLKGNR